VENKNAASGALFWYEKKDAELEDEGKKTKDRSCMPIHSITDVILGKAHPIFATKCANLCPDETALTITGMSVSKRGKEESFSLHLEADHPSTTQAWLEALQHLLKEHGRELLDEVAPAAEGEEKATEAKAGRRLSVVKPAAPAAKSDDPFDILGVESAPTDLGFDENTSFVPTNRPENPFGAESLNDEWNPFGDAAAEPFSFGGAAADPFAGSGFDSFGDNPFGAASASPAGLDPLLGKYLTEMGLLDLAPKFLAERVDMATLRMCSKEDLAGMQIPVGPRLKILDNVKNWQPKS